MADRQQQLNFLIQLRDNFPGLRIENIAKFYAIYNRQIDSGKTDQESKDFIYSMVPFILNMQNRAHHMPPPEPERVVGGKKTRNSKRKGSKGSKGKTNKTNKRRHLR